MSVPELAAELVRLKVDLIVVTGVQPTLAAKKATTTIPIVFASAPDSVGLGLVANLARPGGHVTGLSSLTPELNTKRLEILKDTIPKLARVGLLWTLTGRGGDVQLKQLRAAAQALKLWPKSREPRGLSASILPRVSLNMRARKLPIVV